jgi:hypothetical protein
MELVAGTALIAGIPKDRILNCMKKDELLGWADNVRSRVHTRRTKSNRTRHLSYFFWTWHRGTPQLLSDLDLVVMPLSENQLRANVARGKRPWSSSN